MELTLTPGGVQKIAQQVAALADHAACTLNGEPLTIPIFRKKITPPQVTIFVYLDDASAGEVQDVRLIDTDGDVLAQSGRMFQKPHGKGLYVAFRYRVREVQVDDIY